MGSVGGGGGGTERVKEVTTLPGNALLQSIENVLLLMDPHCAIIRGGGVMRLGRHSPHQSPATNLV